ncbi:hypothetical protein [Methylobacterium nodulans]|uniref:Uncharacterized protein n=1 Tax=Methylobacterium nodulans (strain LMG 21967 / CNCM I-2342 / ORS 2060) TaxID=460265 RepID=B8IRQ7_METNO|nr:hypothetical protein [Methylobacterium nodulans]ACL60607.1 hypothetical protein Mnod_5778 [Methylobacterium nodulans ORS 2060]
MSGHTGGTSLGRDLLTLVSSLVAVVAPSALTVLGGTVLGGLVAAIVGVGVIVWGGSALLGL